MTRLGIVPVIRRPDTQEEGKEGDQEDVGWETSDGRSTSDSPFGMRIVCPAVVSPRCMVDEGDSRTQDCRLWGSYSNAVPLLSIKRYTRPDAPTHLYLQGFLS
jgi:hypothetical protein